MVYEKKNKQEDDLLLFTLTLLKLWASDYTTLYNVLHLKKNVTNYIYHWN